MEFQRESSNKRCFVISVFAVVEGRKTNLSWFAICRTILEVSVNLIHGFRIHRWLLTPGSPCNCCHSIAFIQQYNFALTFVAFTLCRQKMISKFIADIIVCRRRLLGTLYRAFVKRWRSFRTVATDFLQLI